MHRFSLLLSNSFCSLFPFLPPHFSSFCFLNAQLKKIDSFVLNPLIYILLNKKFLEQEKNFIVSLFKTFFATFCLAHIKNGDFKNLRID